MTQFSIMHAVAADRYDVIPTGVQLFILLSILPLCDGGIRIVTPLLMLFNDVCVCNMKLSPILLEVEAKSAISVG